MRLLNKDLHRAGQDDKTTLRLAIRLKSLQKPEMTLKPAPETDLFDFRVFHLI